MAEYSRLASGRVLSTGGQTAVVLPFIPNYIEITNTTRLTAVSGVTRAWWATDMGQGAAALTTTGAGPADGSSYVTSNGFSTVQAGLSLQYGPNFLLGGSGGIAKTSSSLLTVTTTANHGLTTGQWVVFNNLYQSTTTGMQQIAGIPFLVTVTGATTFTVSWVGNSSGLTAITTGGLNTLAAFKVITFPVLYAPGVAFPWSITQATNAVVTTTAPHNFVAGQEIAFRIPLSNGMTQLNSLPNSTIPGSPIYGYVVSVQSSTQFTTSIDTTAYTAFSVNVPFASFPRIQFAQVVAVGDVNTGGYIYNGGQLYPSPSVFNGYTASTTVGVNTINGPAIQGAFYNATFQGFIIGSSIAGTAADVIQWRAYLHDLNT